MLRFVSFTTFFLFFLLTSSLWGKESSLKESSSSEIRDLKWGNINFIHTTDTHGWYSGHLNQHQYSGNWGDFISFVSHLRDLADANNQDLLVIDTGDKHDGNGFTDVTVPNGEKAIPIFIKQDYDLVTIGNHELYLLENSKQEFEMVAHHFQQKYVCSNVEYILPNGTSVPFGNKFKYFETPKQHIRILSFAFLFDFQRYNSGTVVTPIKQAVKEQWFQDALESYGADKVDMLVIFGHIPVSHDWPELYFLHTTLREHYPNTTIQYFGGHSHIRDFSILDDYSTGLQSGRFCETVGWLSINTSSDVKDLKERFSRSYIDFNLDSFSHHTGKSIGDFATPEGSEVSKSITSIREELKLNKTIGYINENYYVDYVPFSHPKNLFKLLSEKILPTLTPSKKEGSHCDERIIIINSGSVRYDLYKGPYTLDTQYIVSPFENDWVKITIPKYIATQISKKLNDHSYILADRDSVANLDLLPAHQRYKRIQLLNKFEDTAFGSSFSEQSVLKTPLELLPNKRKLSKGYVTHDDFGDDGDDTPHKPVINFPIPNVVDSQQLNPTTSNDTLVDVVFYDFVTPNIKWALNELAYHDVDVEKYSDEYLGLLLNAYVKKNGV